MGPKSARQIPLRAIFLLICVLLTSVFVVFRVGVWGLLLLGFVLTETYRLVWGERGEDQPGELERTTKRKKRQEGDMRSYVHLDTKALVMLAQDGDRSALSMLIQRETPALLAYASSYSRSFSHTADDFVQATWERIIVRLPTLREPRYFRTWAVRILQRVTQDAASVERFDPLDDAELPDGESLFRQSVRQDEVLTDHDVRRMLRWMADHVDSETTSIVVLRGLGGLKWKDTVKQMNRLHRASAPWSKSKCETRIRKITNSQARSLRRLLGGEQQ